MNKHVEITKDAKTIRLGQDKNCKDMFATRFQESLLYIAIQLFDKIFIFKHHKYCEQYCFKKKWQKDAKWSET